MKNIKYIVVIAALSLLAGCSFQTKFKHVQSNVAGLDRKVTLYSNDGSVITNYNGRLKVENHGGSCSFIVNGKVIIISGTYIIEEI